MAEKETPPQITVKKVIEDLHIASENDSFTSVAVIVIDEEGQVRIMYHHDGKKMAHFALAEAARQLTEMLRKSLESESANN